MVQTGALSGPLVWLVSPKVELYKDAGDSFSWCLVKIELTPTNRPAIGAWKPVMAAVQTLPVDEERCYPASRAEMKEPLTHRR